MVVFDYFTKRTEYFSDQAKTVAILIFEEVFVQYGISFTLHSEQRCQYESPLFEKKCKVLHIKKTRTTPYHPQSDGMGKRFKKTLVTILSAYVNDHHSDWEEHLLYVMMAYITSLQETTCFTPNQLMLRREGSTPLDIMYEIPISVKYIPRDNRKENTETVHTFVRENMKTAIVRLNR